MKKVFAFIAFTYHYSVYQIPMKLMVRAKEEAESIRNGGGTHAEFYAVVQRFYKWALIVDKHQAKCDHYQSIIES